MERFPKSLISFQRMFPDEAACAAWLFSMRWPEGFQCPGCGHDHGWALRAKAHTFECTSCHRQTSVTAGTILHGSKLDLTVWFSGGLSDGDPFERHLRPSAAEAARSRVLSHGLDAGRQTAPGDGRSRPQSVVGAGRDRRNLPAFPDQERPRRRRPRAKP